MRTLACLALACALLVLPSVGAGAPPASSSGHASKRCGIIAKGSNDYRVKARNARCRFARRWSRRYLRSGAEPRGFSCYRPGTDISFYCAKSSKAYWGERL